MGNSWTN